MSGDKLTAWPEWGTGLLWFWIGAAYEGWHLDHFSWWEAPLLVASSFVTVAAIVLLYRVLRRRALPSAETPE